MPGLNPTPENILERVEYVGDLLRSQPAVGNNEFKAAVGNLLVMAEHAAEEITCLQQDCEGYYHETHGHFHQSIRARLDAAWNVLLGRGIYRSMGDR